MTVCPICLGTGETPSVDLGGYRLPQPCEWPQCSTATERDSVPPRDADREPANQPDSGSSSGGAADG